MLTIFISYCILIISKGGVEMSVYYKIGDFAEKIGVSTATLRRWDKEGVLKPAKVTEGGTRYYSEAQYLQYINKFLYRQERVVIGYCRVSSYKQKDDLERQVEKMDFIGNIAHWFASDYGAP